MDRQGNLETKELTGLAMMGKLKDEGGSALVGALMLVVVMTLVGAALFQLGVVETRLIEGDKVSAQTIYCAEAGIARALAEIIPAPDVALSWAGVTQTLSTAEGSCQYVATDVRITFPRQLRVTGTIGSLSQQTIEVTAQAFSHGISSGGGSGQPFTIDGNLVIEGSCGSLHVNGDLVLSGNPSFDGNATSSGSYDASQGNPVIGGQSGGGLPFQPVPSINPTDFLSVAQTTLPPGEVFQMKSNGDILDGAGTVITTLAAGDEFRGWKYKPAFAFQWVYEEVTPNDGTYYMEGSVDVEANPGTTTDPWTATIIATGNIQVSGNPHMSPHLADTLLVAGLDINIDGNPAVPLELNGIIAAHEQIRISGNPTIAGIIIAEDAPSTSDLVQGNSIEGNPTIVSDCQLNPGVGSLQVGVWIWQECKDTGCST